MAFWSSTNLGQPEPKRNYRFLVYVGGFEPWVAKKVTKPSFSVSESEHTYINHKFYYPGRVEWNTVDVTFVDPGSPDTTQSVYDILINSGYFPPETSSDVITMSKGAAVAALGDIRIQMLGDQFAGGESGNSTGEPLATGGEVLEEWMLYNAWLKEVKFGDLDYTSDDLVEITMTMRYDYAKLNAHNLTGLVRTKPQAFSTLPGTLIVGN